MNEGRGLLGGDQSDDDDINEFEKEEILLDAALFGQPELAMNQARWEAWASGWISPESFNKRGSMRSEYDGTKKAMRLWTGAQAMRRPKKEEGKRVWSTV